MGKNFFTLIMEGIDLIEQDGEPRRFRWGRALAGAAGLGILGAAAGGIGGAAKVGYKFAKVAKVHAARKGTFLNKTFSGPTSILNQQFRKNTSKRLGGRIAGMNRQRFGKAIAKGAGTGLGAGIVGGAAFGGYGGRRMEESAPQEKYTIGPVEKGGLHRSLKMKHDKPISDAKLEAAKKKAKKTGNKKLMKRVVFAQNARKWNKDKGE